MLPKVVILLLLTSSVSLISAQTYTTLYSFTPTSGFLGDIGTNGDGAAPRAGLILSSNTLYGAAFFGGSAGFGTLFAVTTDGANFTNIHNFAGSGGVANPIGGLSLSSNVLYGTTQFYGSAGYGSVFAINTDGTGFTNLHSFKGTSGDPYYTNSDGANPMAGLILSGSTLYGTASDGGDWGYGTVFSVNTDGTRFTNLHSFAAASAPNYTNGEGANPGVLILSGNDLYGTAVNGGSFGRGTVFKIEIDGTRFTNLHSFAAASASNNINNEGANPVGGVILSGNTLYGSAYQGGVSGNGTVFALNIDGTHFTNLHNFTYGSDGANPLGGLILSGNNLYGATQYGASLGNGTVFAINSDGTGFTNLYDFTDGGEGAIPYAGLILSGNTFYGTTYYGGTSGNGTVYNLSFVPQLTIISSGTNVILTWPTKLAGFDFTSFILQSSTNLGSPTAWVPVTPLPISVNGQNTVTNPVFGTQKFYRLSQSP